jgi:hypothetical protein
LHDAAAANAEMQEKCVFVLDHLFALRVAQRG